MLHSDFYENKIARGSELSMAQIIEAIYENGVLKPLEPINMEEHTKVHIIVESEDQRNKRIEKILELIGKSGDGLSEEQLVIMEGARINQNFFFPERTPSK